jgi:hypothetical protein
MPRVSKHLPDPDTFPATALHASEAKTTQVCRSKEGTVRLFVFGDTFNPIQAVDVVV